MSSFQQHRQTRLLHALSDELNKHQDNLQRALDGKSVFYLPDEAQREHINFEFLRIKSMLTGVDTLRKHWSLDSLTGSHYILNPKNYQALRVAAGIAYMQVTYCRLKCAHPSLNDYEQQGLLDLFVYFDAKIDAADLTNENYYVYNTLQTVVGYTERKRAEVE